MKFPDTLTVRVAVAKYITPLIRHFILTPAESSDLPRFSAGSHVQVHIPTNGRVQRNAYSLLGSPRDRSCYQIAVRRQEPSHGGSVYLHDQVSVGDILHIGLPANLFPLDRLASRQLLIAGGIGITPLMSYLHERANLPASFQLHYAFRDAEHAAFVDRLRGQLGEDLRTYNTARGQIIDPGRLLAAQPLGTHVYVCGPHGLIEAVVEATRALGWPRSHLHFERFAASAPGAPFRVSCARRDLEVEVPGDLSLLDALEAAGLEVPNLCRGGVCGQCETGLIEGEAEHRDSYLTPDRHASHIMLCVSRARSERLVLDL